jgi:hypothetical protein
MAQNLPGKIHQPARMGKAIHAIFNQGSSLPA